MGEGEGNDDWFYESINRYKNLNMFELEYPVFNIEPTIRNSLCVSCSNSKKHQLLELSLPKKLTTPSISANPSEVRVTSDTDLKIKCGTFTHTLVSHMKTSNTERTVVTSRLNCCGVAVYNLSSDDSDDMKKESLLKCELENPHLALNGTELALTKSAGCPIFFMDLNTGQEINKVKPHDDFVNFDEQSSAYIDYRTVAICNHSNGQAQLYDTRDFTLTNNIKSWTTENKTSWSFTSLYECSEKSSSNIQSSYLAMVSSSGILQLYDSRNWIKPLINKTLETKWSSSRVVQVRLKPDDSQWVSVSGGDGNVYVYQDAKLQFVHDGHWHDEGHSADTVTTAHAWAPGVPGLLISAADNGTIHTWQFQDNS